MKNNHLVVVLNGNMINNGKTEKIWDIFEFCHVL